MRDGTIRPVFSNLSIVHARRRASYPRHQHPDYQIALIERGQYRCTLNEVSLQLSHREMLVVKPGDWHADECLPPTRYSTVNFRLGSDLAGDRSLSLFTSDVRPEQQIVRPAGTQCAVLMRDMEREASLQDPVSAMVLDALLRQFFWRMVRYLPRDVISPQFLQQSSRQAFAARLHRLFQAHLGTQLTIPDMACELNVSERTLTYHCREALGDSPAHAFMRYKAEHAARVLAGTGVSVKELAVSLGFQNQYHFSRVFKRFIGIPPVRVRTR